MTNEVNTKPYPFRCVSMNVNGLNNPVKLKKVMTYLNSMRADIAFIQETHLLEKESKKLERGWVQLAISNCYSSKTRGVSILFRKNLRIKIQKTYNDPEGRILLAKVQIEETDYILGCIYAPNIEDPDFIHSISQEVLQLNSSNVILAGDFNLVLDPLLDKTGPFRQKTSPTRTAIEKLCRDLGLTDIWRLVHPTSREYTFFSPVHNTQSRIDIFLISKTLSDVTCNSWIEVISISDHALIGLDLMPPDAPIRSPRWRLNTTLLTDPTFKEMINKDIEEFLKLNIGSVKEIGTIWETLKCVIRGKMISYASRKKKERNAKLLNAMETLRNANKRYRQRGTNENLTVLIRAKQAVNLIHSDKAEFALFRLRQNYWESGERAGKLLSYRLKQMESQKLIDGIRGSDGNIHTTSLEINQEFASYYSNLYKNDINPSEEDINLFLNKLSLPSIDTEISNQLIRPFSIEEITMAIDNMQSGKSPGPDGFPVEFFKSFKNILVPILQKMFTECQTSGSLPYSSRGALITVIPKSGKPPEECASYRPISLINVDSKIYSKVLAQRMGKLMPHIISHHQVGFIKDREGTSNTRLLLDLLNLTRDSKEAYATISLDAEKAFDRVNWDFLFCVLKNMKFPPEFINMIKIIYNGPLSRVVTNGVISESFALERGTRQGCPLSPLLFDIALEPLAASIRLDTEIHGITVHGKEYKEIMYADDTLLFISKPETTVPKLLSVIDQYSSISGYKINWSKSEVMPLSKCCYSSHFAQWPFKWSSDNFKYLGIIFQPDLNKIMPSNIDRIIDNLSTDIARWSALNLSLWGKINCIKMNFSPKILYILRSIPLRVPTKSWKRLKKIVRTFLWGEGKKPMLSFKKLELPVDKGGFNFPNWELYQKATILHQAIKLTETEGPEPLPPWAILEQDCMSPIPCNLILSTKLCPQSKKYLTSVRWTRAIWTSLSKSTNKEFYRSLDAPIWGNPLIKGLFKKTIWKDWTEKKILFLKDIIQDGHVIPFNMLKEKFLLPDSWKKKHETLLRIFFDSQIKLNQRTNNVTDTLNSIMKISRRLKMNLAWIYKNLTSNVEFNMLEIKMKWSTRLNHPITELEWQSILKNIAKCTHDQRLQWTQQKIIFNLYWTPLKMQKLRLRADDLCWNCGHTQGNLVHMFWSCRRTQSFWTEIFIRINMVLGTSIMPDPILVIMGCTANIKNLSPHKKKWLIAALLCAKREILFNWKSTQTPSVTSWLNSLTNLGIMEKILWSRCDRLNIYNSIWGDFMETYGS